MNEQYQLNASNDRPGGIMPGLESDNDSLDDAPLGTRHNYEESTRDVTHDRPNSAGQRDMF